jgi:hypothetical protein
MTWDLLGLLDGLPGELRATLAFREFTAWAPWAKRSELRTRRWGDRVDGYGGVYLLSHDPAPTDTPADPLGGNIIYVGEGGWLQRRWGYFERSARDGKDGHSGGHSYRERFGSEHWSSLHVAAFPVWFGEEDTCDERLLDAYRLAVERAIILAQCALGQGNQLLNKK